MKKNIIHQYYEDVLLNKEERMHKMKTIRSKKHELGNYIYNIYFGRWDKDLRIHIKYIYII